MHCRICKEPLRVSELKRGTCQDCEEALNEYVKENQGKRKTSLPKQRSA
jgi:hypothetical protein